MPLLDKLSFKSLASFDESFKKMILAQRRQRKETLREVYLDSKSYVYKRYIIKQPSFFYVKPWVNEAVTLIKANGLHMAKHVDLYKGINSEGDIEIVHKKTFIAGEPLEIVTKKHVKKLAVLLADLHKLGLVTRDPHKKNFFEDAKGDIYVVDMGKAHLHRFRSPLYFYNIGSEFAKLMHRTIEENNEFWDRFITIYFQHHVMSKLSRKVVMLCYYICQFNRKQRRNL